MKTATRGEPSTSRRNDRIAATGRDPVPEKKLAWCYRYEANKVGLSRLTPVPSESVTAARVEECPVQMEGIVHDVRTFGKKVSANAFEVHPSRLAQSDFMKFVTRRSA